MSRVSWDRFGNLSDELARLQRELQRAFGQSGSAPAEEVPANGYPPVNVWEDAEHVYVEAELPGCEHGDLEVLVQGRQLTIKGRRSAPAPDKGVWHRQERGAGAFVRSVNLPGPVDADQVDADLKLGVLTIRLAKHSEVRPKRILVREMA